MPIIFFDAETGKKFCIKLYALVWPGEALSMGMLAGQTGLTFLIPKWEGRTVTYDMKFDNGKRAKVEYRLVV
jgi:hypothetical protein